MANASKPCKPAIKMALSTSKQKTDEKHQQFVAAATDI